MRIIHKKCTTADAASSSIFPSIEVACVALMTNSVAFMEKGWRLPDRSEKKGQVDKTAIQCVEAKPAQLK
jgi:hypothetical protein